LLSIYRFYSRYVAMSFFRRLVADFSLLRVDFNPIQVRVEFVVDAMAPNWSEYFCCVLSVLYCTAGRLWSFNCLPPTLTDSFVKCHICILSVPLCMHSVTQKSLDTSGKLFYIERNGTFASFLNLGQFYAPLQIENRFFMPVLLE
jgi:hypothetical protein